MADEKITELPSLATAAATDLLAIVGDPSGGPITKKVTVTNLLKSGLDADFGALTAASPATFSGTGGPNITLRGTSPSMEFDETDGIANEHLWSSFVKDQTWEFGPATDAGGVTSVIKITRTLGVADLVEFTAPAVFTGSGTSTISIEGTAPLITLLETDAAADEGGWATFANAGIWRFGPATDAGGVTSLITITRTAGVADLIDFSAPLSATYLQTGVTTTAALNAIGNAINTAAGKVDGAMVFNTTTNKPVWAVGNADGDVWVDATGATAHTPV